MNTIKRATLLLFLPSLFLIPSCRKNYNDISLTVDVRESSNPIFNNITLNCTNKEMNKAGFEYGDMVDVHVVNKDSSKTKDYTIAYITNYNEAGTYNKCLVDYESRGDFLNISPGVDNDSDSENFKDGKCTIKMHKKGGYKNTLDLCRVTTKLTYDEVGENNSRYANFRDVVQLGTISGKIAGRRLYRGSSPFNPKRNPDRCLVADKMLDYFVVNSEISISHEDNEALSKMMEPLDPKKSATRRMYDTRNEPEISKKEFFTNNLGGEFFDPKAGGAEVCKILDYMYGKIDAYNEDQKKPIEEQSIVAPRFYIHCDEGKDRTGFLIMALEALCGCFYSDIVNDFMETFFDYYNISIVNNKDKYDTIANLTCYRMLYSLLMPIDEDKGETRMSKLNKIDFYNFNAKEEVKNLLKDHSSDPEKFIQESASKYLVNVLMINKTKEQAEIAKSTIAEYLKGNDPNK